MRDIAKKKTKLDETLNIVFDNYPYHLEYYIRLVNRKKQQARLKPKDKLEAGDLVACSEIETDKYLREHYLFDEVNHYDYLFIYHIPGKK